MTATLIVDNIASDHVKHVPKRRCRPLYIQPQTILLPKMKIDLVTSKAGIAVETGQRQ